MGKSAGTRKNWLESETHTIRNLIRLLEMRGDYTVEELADLYASNSFNGSLFPFIEYVVKDLTNNNRRKTAGICTCAKAFRGKLSARDTRTRPLLAFIWHHLDNQL
jgi:hypothetical protein